MSQVGLTGIVSVVFFLYCMVAYACLQADKIQIDKDLRTNITRMLIKLTEYRNARLKHFPFFTKQNLGYQGTLLQAAKTCHGNLKIIEAETYGPIGILKAFGLNWHINSP